MAGTRIYSPQLGSDIDQGLSNLGSMFAPPSAQQLAVLNQAQTNAQNLATKNAGLDYYDKVAPGIANMMRIGDNDAVKHFGDLVMQRQAQAGATPSSLDAQVYARDGNAGNTFAGKTMENLGADQSRIISPALAGALGIPSLQHGIIGLGDDTKMLPGSGQTDTVSAPDDGKVDPDEARKTLILNAIRGLPPEQQNRALLSQPWNGSGSGVTINNGGDGGVTGAVDKAYGTDLGKAIGEDVTKGAAAGQTMQQTATMRDAIRSGGDNISYGPTGPLVLAAKRVGGALIGRDLAGVPESDVINNVGYGLATAAAKGISNRPSQAEFARALETKPGLAMSKTGSLALLNVMDQHAKSDQDIAGLANDTTLVVGPNGAMTTAGAQNRANWIKTKSDYYAAHPIMSPFNPQKPFGADDINQMTTAAQQAGVNIAPTQTSSVATGPGANAAPPSAAGPAAASVAGLTTPSAPQSAGSGSIPTISDPMQVRSLPSGSRFMTPDGRMKVAP